MDLDLRLARHFIVLAEQGHFGRAAKTVHLTQPALTKQIQALERQAGSALIDRTQRPWRLTAAGEEVLTLSRDLCSRADRTRAALAENDTGSTITIGFQSSGSGGWPVGAILLACGQALGRLVRCRVLDTTAYVRALTEGEIDLLVTRPAPDRPDVLSVGVLAEARMLLVPRRWPEAGAERPFPRRSCAMTRYPWPRKNIIWASQSSAVNGHPWLKTIGRPVPQSL